MAFTIAADMAKYLYKQDEARRKIVSFSTDIQGLVPQFLDKIMVSHNALQWGEAGEVYSKSGDDLIISDKLTDLTEGKTIVFRDIDGFSYNEIAEKLNCEVGTVKSRIFRARESLKALLEPYQREMSR